MITRDRNSSLGASCGSLNHIILTRTSKGELFLQATDEENEARELKFLTQDQRADK